jgi:FkbM family methyltransferase
MTGDVMQLRAAQFYGQFLAPGDLAFDIGANVGERTQILCDLGARVVAVEPQASCVAQLASRFGDRVEVVEAAVGAVIGEAELLLASYSTLSSLSSEWIDAVQRSGRFSEFSWPESITVPVTTLDELITRFGMPAFCKIDVEGYELEVVRGLTVAIPALSFEFDVERAEPRLAALAHLDELGMRRFNFSWGESFELAMPRWCDIVEMREFLMGPGHSVATFGDVYAAA